LEKISVLGTVVKDMKDKKWDHQNADPDETADPDQTETADSQKEEFEVKFIY
jgi:hypothetical protein